jgi:peptidoglycan/xylan/chitin deacetylase (PgdA/CDA1 family)
VTRLPSIGNSVVRRLRSALVRALLRHGLASSFLGLLPRTAVIFMYHQVNGGDDGRTDDHPGAAVAAMESEFRFLREHMDVVPLSWLASRLARGQAFPNRCASVTFDDGYRDTYDLALPLMKKYSIPATIFVATGFVGQNETFWWDRLAMVLSECGNTRVVFPCPRTGSSLEFDLHSASERQRAAARLADLLTPMPRPAIDAYLETLERQCALRSTYLRGPKVLTWEEISEMAGVGIEFGAHTVTHPDLASVSPAVAASEILESKRALERQGLSVSSFAYPFGQRANYNQTVEKLVRDAGFGCCCTAVRGAVGRRASAWELPRLSGPRRSASDTMAGLLFPVLAAGLNRRERAWGWTSKRGRSRDWWGSPASGWHPRGCRGRLRSCWPGSSNRQITA